MCELGGRMYGKGTRNTSFPCPFLSFTENRQNNVTDAPVTSRSDPPPSWHPRAAPKCRERSSNEGSEHDPP